jgi:hypothetical protein
MLGSSAPILGAICVGICISRENVAGMKFRFSNCPGWEMSQSEKCPGSAGVLVFHVLQIACNSLCDNLICPR